MPILTTQELARGNLVDIIVYAVARLTLRFWAVLVFTGRLNFRIDVVLYSHFSDNIRLGNPLG